MSVSPEIRKKIDSIAFQERYKVTGVSALAGGDINQVFLLKTSRGDQVLKLNSAAKFPGMFEAEKQGLEILRNSNTFVIPEVLAVGEHRGAAYLLLEHIPQGSRRPGFWVSFAENLANLHRCTSGEFGFSHSNYIGSLPQANGSASSASEFYISQRLEPQLRRAEDAGFSLGNFEVPLKIIAEEIPSEAPALVHGDLWNGNYITTSLGEACLIDPSVAYAPREMDLAMMRLFSGFPKEVFQHYNYIFPLPPYHEDRVDLWQLYYLLVHLNIFGSSYLPSAKRILKKYS